MDLTKINFDNPNIGSYIAEVCGIHVGDGYLRYHSKNKEFDISGSYEEQGYYDYHVVPLFNKIFKLQLKAKKFPHRRTYGFCSCNQKIISTLVKVGFPSGKKSTIISIPKIILNSNDKEVYKAFLRGYFDTDGCFTFDKKIYNSSYFKKRYHYYPRIMFTTCSKMLSIQLQKLFKNLSFKSRCYKYLPKVKTENIKYNLQIVGKESLERWVKLISPKNTMKISRYLVWQKFGFCPPNTNYEQRKNILNMSLSPYSFY